MLEVENLVTRYGQIEAVKGISFRVPVGAVVAIIGANGAGKSTTLLTISGVLAPSKGTIRFASELISGLPSHVIASRGIAQVLEGRGIFQHLTVKENLQLGAYLRPSTFDVSQDIELMFQRFPRLAGRSRQLAGTLSGGEQQMLAIARALMSRPRMLLLDEPSMGLAPKIVDEVFSMISQIHDLGMTILLVEQNAFKALASSSFAFVMANGRVVASGNSHDLLQDNQVRKFYLG